MTIYKTADDRSIKGLLHEISEAAYSPAPWPDVIQSLTNLLEADSVSIILRRNQPYARLSDLSLEQDPKFTHEHDSYYVSRNPIRQRAIEVYDKAYSFEDVIPINELQNTEYYNDFVLPARMRDSLKIRRRLTANHTVSLNVTSLRRKPYAPKQKKLCELFSHEIRNTLLQAIAREPAGLSDLGLLETHHGAETALVVVGTDKKLLFANPRAYRLLAFADGLRLTSHFELHLTDPGENDQFQTALDHTLARPPQAAPGLNGSIRTSRPSGDQPHCIDILGISRFYAPTLFGVPGAAVLVRASEDWAPPPMRAIARRFNLTPRTAEVAYWLAWGIKGPAVANRLGMSLETYKKYHRRNLFRHLQVKNQTEFIDRLKHAFPITR